MLEDEGYKLMGLRLRCTMSWAMGWPKRSTSRAWKSSLAYAGYCFTQSELKVFYKDHQLQTCYKPDLVVFDAIVVELKAVAELTTEAQLFNYMRIARQPVGYLLNFGYKGELQWK